MASSVPPLDPPKGKCPICKAPTDAAYRPFCSRRCADVDLSRWLRGAYAIPVEDDADEDGESADGPAASDGEAKGRKP
jgi:endogenous inhibitor of DNA gyrase (YacG/DUF329 family)